MTLYQMSFVYREDALRFRMRITVLREQAKAAREMNIRWRQCTDEGGARATQAAYLRAPAASAPVARAGRADAALLRKGLLPQ